MTLECSSLEQAINVLRKMPLASDANYVLCDGQGNIADVEATTAGPEIPPIRALDILPIRTTISALGMRSRRISIRAWRIRSRGKIELTH